MAWSSWNINVWRRRKSIQTKHLKTSVAQKQVCVPWRLQMRRYCLVDNPSHILSSLISCDLTVPCPSPLPELGGTWPDSTHRRDHSPGPTLLSALHCSGGSLTCPLSFHSSTGSSTLICLSQGLLDGSRDKSHCHLSLSVCTINLPSPFFPGSLYSGRCPHQTDGPAVVPGVVSALRCPWVSLLLLHSLCLVCLSSVCGRKCMGFGDRVRIPAGSATFWLCGLPHVTSNLWISGTSLVG